MKTNSGLNPANQSEAAIFDAALACATPAERAAYLDKACAGSPELRQRVEALLAAHEEGSKFLEPKPDAARPTIRLTLPEEQVGERIGRYKLLQKIGEGGCGVVYMAEQEEPVRRRVALKVIKLGMDTKQVVARFEAERQALALMDHPNIAKIYDAGVTGVTVDSEGRARHSVRAGFSTAESGAQGTDASYLSAGRPFFVMELVKGIPATRYADENKLDTRQRLDLFIQICQAVQHAHQKGIIHRDIKPSNVLVADHDGTPVPKVIDFGIAKATTDQRLTDKTLFTALEQFIGTPAYMSPEQAKLSGLDVDTRSDIYSLGVLLYELLTGKTPFDARRLLDAGFDEIRRIIREEEPPKPSTRLTQELTDVAASRKSAGDSSDDNGGALPRRRYDRLKETISLVRGDLDWIVMKCLEKDRTRRYETANGLAADVQRHLSNEPVVACPPSAAYRFRKMVRRNKAAFVVSTAVIVLIVVGLSISLWLVQKKNLALERALAAERAQQKMALESEANELLSEAAELAMINNASYPAEVEHGLPGNFYIVEKKLREAIKIRRTLHGENDWAADAAEEKLLALLQLRIPDEANNAEVLGLFLKIHNRLKQNPKTKASDIADSALFGLGDYFNEIGKLAEAESYYREAVEIRRRSSSTSTESTENGMLIRAICTLASNLASQNTSAEAKQLFREALEIWSSNPTLPDHWGWGDWGKLNVLRALAWLHVKDGKLAEAAPLFREANSICLEMRDRPSIPDEDLYELADAYVSNKKLPEAEAVLREKTSGDTPIRLWKLWSVVHFQNRVSEADKLLQEALAAERNYHRPWRDELYIQLAISGASPSEASICLDALESLCDTMTNAPSKLESKTLIWKIQGELLAKERQFEAAKIIFVRAFQTNQQDGIAWRCAMLSASLTGDDALLAKLSNQQPTSLEKSSITNLGDGMAWYNHAVEANKRLFAALLPSESEGDFAIIHSLVKYLGEYVKDSDGYLWTFDPQTGEAALYARGCEPLASRAHAAKALAEFRQKQYGNAAATIKKALRYDQQAVGYAVLALTQTHAGEWAAAKTSIEKGFELNQREKEWDDRLVVEILLKEARGLVESKSPTHDASK